MLTDNKAIILFTNHPQVEISRKRITENRSQAKNVLQAFLSNTFEVLADLRNSLEYDLIIATDKRSIESSYFEKFTSRPAQPIQFQLVEQKGCNFDERIKNSLQKTFEKGYSKIVIIGNDCPDLTPAIITKAFQSLEKEDIVIGPADDGGFYLLGLNRYHPDLFLNIQWCTNKVFPQVYENALSVSHKIALISSLADVDSKKQLMEWINRSQSATKRFLLYIIHLVLISNYLPASFYIPFVRKNHHRKRLWQKSPPVGLA